MKKILFITSLLFATSFSLPLNVEGTTTVPIKTKPPIKDDDRPHYPSNIKLLCTIDTNSLSIESSVSTMAIVEIADETGAIVLTEADALNPAMTIDIAYLESGYYTLFITIDDQTFEGKFFL